MGLRIWGISVPALLCAMLWPPLRPPGRTIREISTGKRDVSTEQVRRWIAWDNFVVLTPLLFLLSVLFLGHPRSRLLPRCGAQLLPGCHRRCRLRSRIVAIKGKTPR
eukprot:565123-Rhodomonas_salina.1